MAGTDRAGDAFRRFGLTPTARGFNCQHLRFFFYDSYLVHPKRDIVSLRPEVATIAAVMFGCTPQECEKNGASLF
jgi:hypothetical protein